MEMDDGVIRVKKKEAGIFSCRNTVTVRDGYTRNINNIINPIPLFSHRCLWKSVVLKIHQKRAAGFHWLPSAVGWIVWVVLF